MLLNQRFDFREVRRRRRLRWACRESTATTQQSDHDCQKQRRTHRIGSWRRIPHDADDSLLRKGREVAPWRSLSAIPGLAFALAFSGCTRSKSSSTSLAFSLSLRMRIEPREIQIGLIKFRGHADSGLELFFGSLQILPAHKEDAQIIERFGINRAQFKRSSQRFSRDEASGSVARTACPDCS